MFLLAASHHPPLQILRREPQLRSTRRIRKDDELTLQENIPKDTDPHTTAALNTAKARAATLRHRRVVDITSRHSGGVAGDAEADIREGSVASENVTTVLLAVA